MISIRASSLDEFASCQRRFAAKWLLDDEHKWCSDFGLKRTRRTIGAVVGTAVHSGVAYLLNELKRTGSHGGMLRLSHAKSVASEEMHAASQEPVLSDQTTSNATAGIVAAHKMVQRYHQDVKHEHEPVLVEKGLKMEFDGHQITGTMDSYLIDNALEDLKTGVAVPRPFAQIGCYDLLLKSNGHKVEHSRIRYAKRVRKNVGQPPIELMTLDTESCERHALSVAGQAASGLVHLLETGDPSAFIANPKDMLCSAKYCPAHGSAFCPYGTMIGG